MFDYYKEEEKRQYNKNVSRLRSFFLRLLDASYGDIISTNGMTVTKEVYTSMEKEQFEFLKDHKAELFTDKQMTLMKPVIEEFIKKADYLSVIDGYVYDTAITVPNLALV